jgi:hypothetical protein
VDRYIGIRGNVILFDEESLGRRGTVFSEEFTQDDKVLFTFKSEGEYAG